MPDLSTVPNCIFWLTQDLEDTMSAEERDALLARIKAVYAKFWADFGIVPSVGDSLKLEDELAYYVVARTLQVNDNEYYLNVTIDSYLRILSETQEAA